MLLYIPLNKSVGSYQMPFDNIPMPLKNVFFHFSPPFEIFHLYAANLLFLLTFSGIFFAPVPLGICISNRKKCLSVISMQERDMLWGGNCLQPYLWIYLFVSVLFFPLSSTLALYLSLRIFLMLMQAEKVYAFEFL